MAEHRTKKTRARPRDRQWWMRHVKRCQDSGLSMVAYAAQHQLSLSSLYNWKTLLNREKERGAKAVASGLMSRATKATTQSLRFVEMCIERPSCQQPVEIISPSGWTVRFSPGIDRATALRFLSVLEGRS